LAPPGTLLKKNREKSINSQMKREWGGKNERKKQYSEKPRGLMGPTGGSELVECVKLGKLQSGREGEKGGAFPMSKHSGSTWEIQYESRKKEMKYRRKKSPNDRATWGRRQPFF